MSPAAQYAVGFLIGCYILALPLLAHLALQSQGQR